MTELDLLCVVKADLLQLGQRAGGTGDQNRATDQMIGQSYAASSGDDLYGGYLLLIPLQADGKPAG
jgi:hypothetical protein